MTKKVLPLGGKTRNRTGAWGHINFFESSYILHHGNFFQLMRRKTYIIFAYSIYYFQIPLSNKAIHIIHVCLKFTCGKTGFKYSFNNRVKFPLESE